MKLTLLWTLIALVASPGALAQTNGLNADRGVISNRLVAECPAILPQYESVLQKLRDFENKLVPDKNKPECKSVAENLKRLRLVYSSPERKKVLDVINAKKQGSAPEAKVELTVEEAERIGATSQELAEASISLIENISGNKHCVEGDDRPGLLSSVASVIQESTNIAATVSGPGGAPIALGGSLLAGILKGVGTFFDSKSNYNFKKPEHRELFIKQICIFADVRSEVEDLQNPDEKLVTLIQRTLPTNYRNYCFLNEKSAGAEDLSNYIVRSEKILEQTRAISDLVARSQEEMKTDTQNGYQSVCTDLNVHLEDPSSTYAVLKKAFAQENYVGVFDSELNVLVTKAKGSFDKPDDLGSPNSSRPRDVDLNLIGRTWIDEDKVTGNGLNSALVDQWQITDRPHAVSAAEKEMIETIKVIGDRIDTSKTAIVCGSDQAKDSVQRMLGDMTRLQVSIEKLVSRTRGDLVRTTNKTPVKDSAGRMHSNVGDQMSRILDQRLWISKEVVRLKALLSSSGAAISISSVIAPFLDLKQKIYQEIAPRYLSWIEKESNTDLKEYVGRKTNVMDYVTTFVGSPKSTPVHEVMKELVTRNDRYKSRPEYYLVFNQIDDLSNRFQKSIGWGRALQGYCTYFNKIGDGNKDIYEICNRFRTGSVAMYLKAEWCPTYVSYQSFVRFNKEQNGIKASGLDVVLNEIQVSGSVQYRKEGPRQPPLPGQAAWNFAPSSCPVAK